MPCLGTTDTNICSNSLALDHCANTYKKKAAKETWLLNNSPGRKRLKRVETSPQYNYQRCFGELL